MGYSIVQVRAFLLTHDRLERRRSALMLAVQAVAAQGDKAAFERLQQQLLGDDK